MACKQDESCLVSLSLRLGLGARGIPRTRSRCIEGGTLAGALRHEPFQEAQKGSHGANSEACSQGIDSAVERKASAGRASLIPTFRRNAKRCSGTKHGICRRVTKAPSLLPTPVRARSVESEEAISSAPCAQDPLLGVPKLEETSSV